eukprot:7302595-Prymnesium_polylepis.1
MIDHLPDDILPPLRELIALFKLLRGFLLALLSVPHSHHRPAARTPRWGSWLLPGPACARGTEEVGRTQR